jgi:hypothetical protein
MPTAEAAFLPRPACINHRYRTPPQLGLHRRFQFAKIAIHRHSDGVLICLLVEPICMAG